MIDIALVLDTLVSSDGAAFFSSVNAIAVALLCQPLLVTDGQFRPCDLRLVCERWYNSCPAGWSSRSRWTDPTYLLGRGNWLLDLPLPLSYMSSARHVLVAM